MNAITVLRNILLFFHALFLNVLIFILSSFSASYLLFVGVFILIFHFLLFSIAAALKNLSASSNAEELWPIYKVNIFLMLKNMQICNIFHFNCIFLQDEYKKVYEPEEDRERFEIFAANIKRFVEHNEKYERGEVSFSLGINQFADKKPNENACGCMGVLKPKLPEPDNSN